MLFHDGLESLHVSEIVSKKPETRSVPSNNKDGSDVLQSGDRRHKGVEWPYNDRTKTRRDNRQEYISEDCPWVANPVDQKKVQEWRVGRPARCQINWYIAAFLGYSKTMLDRISNDR